MLLKKVTYKDFTIIINLWCKKNYTFSAYQLNLLFYMDESEQMGKLNLFFHILEIHLWMQSIHKYIRCGK